MNAHLQTKLTLVTHGSKDRIVAPRDSQTPLATSTPPPSIPVLDEDFAETVPGSFAEPDWYEP